MPAQALLNDHGRRTLAAAALVAVTFLPAACGDGSSASRQPPTGLPTKQFQLAYDLCPTAKELKSAHVRQVRATARRQLQRLLAAHRRDPDAKVRTSFEPSNEPGPKFEELTVSQLMRRHLQGVTEVIEVGDPPARRCARRLAKRLRAALRQ